MTVQAEPSHEWPPYLTPPPSMEELLRHAAETDEGMESDNHAIQNKLLEQSVRHWLRDRADVYVGTNVPLYFSALQLRTRDFRVPDVMVVLEARPSAERPFWIVWDEGGQVPNVIVEVLSPSTAETDRTTKHRIYSSVLGVPEYFLFDVDTGSLEGFELATEKRYVPIEPDAAGRLPSRQLGGTFGAVEHEAQGRTRAWMRLFDPEGRVVPTAEEAARQRAEEERQRAEEERQRAEEERQRAEEERQRAEEERQRAEALAAKLAEYERRFGPLD